MNLFHLTEQLFTAYLMITCRVIGLLATMPLIGERTVPWQTKVGLSMIIGFLLIPLAKTTVVVPDASLILFAVALTQEMLLGVLIGYLARLLFGAFQFAVNAIDFQTGLSFIQILSPGTGVNLAVLGQFLNTLMLLLFLELDGHHILLRALGDTIGAVPLGLALPSPAMVEGIVQLFGVFVSVSFQIALPTVMVLLLIDVAMGVVGRVVPQLNVFLVALPVKIMVSLVTLSISLPAMMSLMQRVLGLLGEDLVRLARMMT